MIEEKDFMYNKEIKDIKPEELLKLYLNNTSELKDIDKVLEFYDIVGRVLFLTGEVNDVIADAISHFIRLYNIIDRGIVKEERQPIKLFINTEGGNAVSCLEIIDSITLSETPVYTINIALAASAGFDIFIAGHKRFSYPNATFCWHEGGTSLSQIDAGKFRNYSDWYDRLLQRTKKILLDNTKVTPELYQEKRKDDWWLFPEEAVELGICDEILEVFI